MLDQPHYVHSHAYETNMRLNYGHVLYQPFVNCKTHQQPNGEKERIIYFAFSLMAEDKETLEAACVEFERKFYAATYRHAVYLDPRGWNISQLHDPRPAPDLKPIPKHAWQSVLILGIPESHSSDVHQLTNDIIHQKVTVRQEERASPIRKWMRFNETKIANIALMVFCVVAGAFYIIAAHLHEQEVEKASNACAQKGGIYVKGSCFKVDSVIPMETK